MKLSYLMFHIFSMFPCLVCHIFRIAKNFSRNSTSAGATGKQSAGIVKRSITWTGIIKDDLQVLGPDVSMHSGLPNGYYERNPSS